MSWTDRAILVGLMAVIAISRLHTYHEPADWDVATYSIIGHEISHGKSLYSDAWDIKPPAIFVTYAAGEIFTGEGFGQIYCLGVIAACVTLIAIYHAGSAMGRFAAIFSAIAFTILSGDMGLDANRPNTEAFINACLAWGFVLLVTWNDKHTWKRAIVVGLLLGLATFYKQVALVPAVLLITVHFVMSSRRNAIVMLATILVIWGLVFAYFTATGRAWLFGVTIFQSPRAYGGSVVENLLASFQQKYLFPKFLKSLLPVAMLSLFALFGLRKIPLARWSLLLALMIGTFLAVALPGQFFQHYYQLWLVPLTIGAGWGMRLLTSNSLLRSRWIGCVITGLVIFGMIWWQVPSYRHPPIDWAMENYKSMFVDAQRFGQDLANRLGPGDSFYDWSDEPWLYFVTHRRPPAAGIWRSHTIEGPLASWLTDRTLQQLQKSPPRYVTMWAPDEAMLHHPIYKWIQENYTAIPDPDRKWRQFTLLERK